MGIAGVAKPAQMDGKNVDFVLNCSDFVLKCPDSVLKMSDFVLKMLDFAGKSLLPLLLGKAKQAEAQGAGAVRVYMRFCCVYTCRRLIDLSLIAGAGECGEAPGRCCAGR